MILRRCLGVAAPAGNLRWSSGVARTERRPLENGRRNAWLPIGRESVCRPTVKTTCRARNSRLRSRAKPNPNPSYDSRPPIIGARVGNYSRRPCTHPRIAPWRALDDARRGGGARSKRHEQCERVESGDSVRCVVSESARMRLSLLITPQSGTGGWARVLAWPSRNGRNRHVRRQSHDEGAGAINPRT